MPVKDPEGFIEALEVVREAVEQLRRETQDATEVTVQDLARRSGVSEEVLVAFAEALGELVGDRPLNVEIARRAAVLAAAGQAWENELGPLLSSAQVRDLLGGVSRQRVDELLRSRRLIGLRDSSGRRRFPAFQFHEGQPLGPLIAAFWTVADAAGDEWTAASWCVADDEALAGDSPSAWARRRLDAARLARVAHQDAARLAR